MNVIKNLLVLIAIIPSIMATNNSTITQQAQPTGNAVQSSAVTTQSVTQPKKLSKDVEKIIKQDLKKQLDDLKESLKTNKNTYEHFAEKLYRTITDKYIGKKLINNVNEIEYLWNDLLKPTLFNKHLKQNLQKQLDQYAKDNGITFKGQSVNNQEIAKYSIDSLQTIIRFYRDNALEYYENIKNNYSRELNNLYNDLFKTTNYNEFFWIYLDIGNYIRGRDDCFFSAPYVELSYVDREQVENNLSSCTLQIFKANEEKLIQHFQKLPTTYTENVSTINASGRSRKITLQEYEYPIFMYYLKQNIDNRNKTIDDLNNSWFYRAKKNVQKLEDATLEITGKSAFDFMFVVTEIMNEKPDNIFLENYINKYITNKISQIKKYIAEGKEDYKTACLAQLGCVLSVMKEQKEWQTQYSNVEKVLLDNLALSAKDIIKICDSQSTTIDNFFVTNIDGYLGGYEGKKPYMHYYETASILF